MTEHVHYLCMCCRIMQRNRYFTFVDQRAKQRHLLAQIYTKCLDRVRLISLPLSITGNMVHYKLLKLIYFVIKKTQNIPNNCSRYVNADRTVIKTKSFFFWRLLKFLRYSCNSCGYTYKFHSGKNLFDKMAVLLAVCLTKDVGHLKVSELRASSVLLLFHMF